MLKHLWWWNEAENFFTLLALASPSNKFLNKKSINTLVAESYFIQG